jgi:DNA-binding response OmpR family regulator
MRRLRQKVEVDANRPMHVQTVRGVGYRLMVTPGSQTSEASD